MTAVKLRAGLGVAVLLYNLTVHTRRPGCAFCIFGRRPTVCAAPEERGGEEKNKNKQKMSIKIKNNSKPNS